MSVATTLKDCYQSDGSQDMAHTRPTYFKGDWRDCSIGIQPRLIKAYVYLDFIWYENMTMSGESQQHLSYCPRNVKCYNMATLVSEVLGVFSRENCKYWLKEIKENGWGWRCLKRRRLEEKGGKGEGVNAGERIWSTEKMMREIMKRNRYQVW